MKTRARADAKGLKPVAPSKSNRKEPWEYAKDAYKRHNEAERFFKEFRRIATRYEKLDAAFIRRLLLAFIFIVSQSQRQTRHKDK
jgi:transposase